MPALPLPARKRLLLAVATIIVALAATAPGLTHRAEPPVGSASSPTVGSVEELVGLASSQVDPGSWRGFYLLHLSGRVAVFDAAAVPGVRGVRVDRLCLLAHTRGRWVQVPFTVFDRSARLPSGDTLFLTPKRVGPESKIAVKLPPEPPEPVSPLAETPPQARGARWWVWVNISLPGSPHSYPLLVAWGSREVEMNCATTPYSNQLLSTLSGYWLPWPLSWALRHGYLVEPHVIEDLREPVRVNAQGGANLSWLRPPRPLPDGGGSNGGAMRAGIIYALPLMENTGGADWEPVMLTLSSGEAASFTVRVFQESGGVYTAERVWRKFRLTLFMTPTSADSNAIYAPLVNATIFPGTSREETQSAADVIWGDETAVVSFEFESPDTYGSHTAEIPVSLLLDTTVCYVDDTVQECDVEWNVTATVTLEVEWLDYQYYIPGEQSKVLYPARLDPLVGVGGGGDIASLYLPPGSTGSSEAYLLVAPLPMAALFENITGSSISEPRYNFSITLYAKPAPGDYFPGGTLHLQLPGLGGCEAQLPPMSPGSEELVSCEIDNISLASLWDYLTGRIIEGLLWANTSEPASSGVSLVVGVPGGQGSVSPVSLTGIPIVNVPFNAGSEDEGWVLTPIARYNDSSLAGYLALTPTARLAAVEQPRVKDGPYVRWAPLQVVLSSRSSNLHLEVSLAASQFESQLYSYAPAGRMTWFTAKFTLSGLDSCEEGSVEVYGLSREGGTPSQLERYLEVAARVVGWMSRVVESLKRVSDALNIAVYILKYKSITQVETSYACSGGTATYWVNATQTGWQPDGFEDDVHIALYESLNTVDCASSSIYLALGTQHIASLGSYTYPSTRVCLPSALSSGGGG